MAPQDTNKNGDSPQSDAATGTSESKGKGKANGRNDGDVASPHAQQQQPSLLSSAFSSASQDLAGTMASLALGQGKGGSRSANASSQAGQLASMASELGGGGAAGYAGSSQHFRDGHLGGRQGMRSGGAAAAGFETAILDEGLMRQPTPPSFDARPTQPLSLDQSSSSLPSTNRLDSGFGTFEALNAGLHDLIRGDTSSEQNDYAEALSARPELLDPAYHEAWARSIPGTATDAGLPAATVSQAQSSAGEEGYLSDAWLRSTQSTAADQAAPLQQRQEYPINFLEALAAEEEAELAASEGFVAEDNGNAAYEDASKQPPPPEPASALQATDPREALAFLLGPTDDEKQKIKTKLEGLAQELRAEQAKDTRSESQQQQSQPVMGLDRHSRRRERRRKLADIEYELALAESKLGYVEVSQQRWRAMQSNT